MQFFMLYPKIISKIRKNEEHVHILGKLELKTGSQKMRRNFQFRADKN
jgi:hypothetical protein